ncbi:hypothetical protein PAHAL_9G094700 [Panicum hallii]|jgi:hypothetical protein|uniref:Uncharacterized protein n=1 Tax=Panicum hallii TaxID=206008 RepID=A0A2T8I0P3_9POAL|nr:hypothetical protein PAHAL_9G094700 [Panicum hallii]
MSSSPTFHGIGAANSKGNGLKGHLTSERGQTKNDTQPHRKQRSGREVAKGELNSETTLHASFAEPSPREKSRKVAKKNFGLSVAGRYGTVAPCSVVGVRSLHAVFPAVRQHRSREGAARPPGQRRGREAGASRAHARAAATGSLARRLPPFRPNFPTGPRDANAGRAFVHPAGVCAATAKALVPSGSNGLARPRRSGRCSVVW